MHPTTKHRGPQCCAPPPAPVLRNRTPESMRLLSCCSKLDLDTASSCRLDGLLRLGAQAVLAKTVTTEGTTSSLAINDGGAGGGSSWLAYLRLVRLVVLLNASSASMCEHSALIHSAADAKCRRPHLAASLPTPPLWSTPPRLLPARLRSGGSAGRYGLLTVE